MSSDIEIAESIVLEAGLDGLTVEALAHKLRASVLSSRKLVKKSMNIISICERLFHKESFVDWELGADQLEDILEKLMTKNNGYISYAQLYDYARAEMQMFLNDNDMNDQRKVFDLAEHLFSKECYHGKRYIFWLKTHISDRKAIITSKLDLVCKFARDNGGYFKESDLEAYLHSLGIRTASLRQQMGIYDSPMFLFYQPGYYITLESMKIDDVWLDKLAQALFELFNDNCDHVVLRDIQPCWYALLPALPNDRTWTALLLQSVLTHYGERVGARTISAMPSQSVETLHAMVVSLDSEVQTFSDAVIAYLLEEHISERRFNAEALRQMLVKRGLIAGHELICNMPKALPNDDRFAWTSDGQTVIISV